MSSSSFGHLGIWSRNIQSSSGLGFFYQDGLSKVESKGVQLESISLAGKTRLPSVRFPARAMLCITLSLSSGMPHLLAFSFLFSSQQPALADPLNTMKAREYLQKGNVHLTRYEFQQALDAYTECLLCDPSNRTAKDNIVLTHNNWGIWWFQKRKYKEARDEWEQALTLNPMDRNARANMQVLKITLKQQGLNEDGEKPAPAASLKPGSDFPPSQAIILTPGLKASPGNSAGASPESNGESGSPGAGESSSGAAFVGGNPPAPSESSSGGAVIIKKAAPVTTSGGDSSSSVSTYSSGSTYTNDLPAGKFTTAPMTPESSQTNSANEPSASASATAGGSQEENIEDSLGQIEQKIYGRKQDSLPIMKRLEKLETDTHGKTKSGTIKERIDTLRKSYGF